MEFFDHYLKGKENNFVKDTPKVRWTLLRHGDLDPISDVVIPDYPHPNTDYRKLYLSANGQLSNAPVKEVGMSSYLSRGEGANSATFDFKFDKKTIFIGLPKIIVHMSCDDHDDMNVFVVLQKVDGESDSLATHCTSEQGRLTPVTHAHSQRQGRRPHHYP
jgi:predicted acyl esterase